MAILIECRCPTDYYEANYRRRGSRLSFIVQQGLIMVLDCASSAEHCRYAGSG